MPDGVRIMSVIARSNRCWMRTVRSRVRARVRSMLRSSNVSVYVGKVPMGNNLTDFICRDFATFGDKVWHSARV